MTREEKENLLREAVDILIKLDNHLMTSRDNAEFSSWVEDLIDNGCREEQKEEKWISVTEAWMMEELENQIKEGKGCLGRDEE